MRSDDATKHPAAVAREKRETAKFWAGMAIGLAGVAAAFMIDGALYLGFGVALVGAGIVPFETLSNKVLRFMGKNGNGEA